MSEEPRPDPHPILLTDADVRTILTPRLAVDAAKRALVGAYRGALAAPPRLHAEIGDLTLAFTVGGYPNGRVGFRVYGTWPGSTDQAVLLWDDRGRLKGIVIGRELGVRRTGAIGATAAAALARADAAAVAIVGSGSQAWSQLWALTAVLTPIHVRVYSPTSEHRARFAERARRELGLPTHAVASAEEAVTDADLVILATRSPTPVVDAGWIKDGAHVTTVGPKLIEAHETPPELAERAALVASDSPDQAGAYDRPFFTDRRLVHLGAVLAGEARGRQGDREITLFCSTGLAGSEVVVASSLLADD